MHKAPSFEDSPSMNSDLSSEDSLYLTNSDGNFHSPYSNNSGTYPLPRSQSDDSYVKTNSSSKSRRRLCKRETDYLQAIFDASPKPNSELRLKIAARLGMSPRAVQIWFQNRRAKAKRDSIDSSSSLCYADSRNFFYSRPSVVNNLSPTSVCHTFESPPSTASLIEEAPPQTEIISDKYSENCELNDLLKKIIPYPCIDQDFVKATLDGPISLPLNFSDDPLSCFFSFPNINNYSPSYSSAHINFSNLKNQPSAMLNSLFYEPTDLSSGMFCIPTNNNAIPDELFQL